MVLLYLLHMTTQTVNRSLWQGIRSADIENSRVSLYIISEMEDFPLGKSQLTIVFWREVFFFFFKGGKFSFCSSYTYHIIPFQKVQNLLDILTALTVHSHPSHCNPLCRTSTPQFWHGRQDLSYTLRFFHDRCKSSLCYLLDIWAPIGIRALLYQPSTHWTQQEPSTNFCGHRRGTQRWRKPLELHIHIGDLNLCVFNVYSFSMPSYLARRHNW